MNSERNLENGSINGSIIAIVALSVLSIILGVFSVWAYLNYADQKRDVDTKISTAAAEASRETSDKKEAEFAERERADTREFVGPADYGRLTFQYPKIWSAYQATDVSQGGSAVYRAYLHPFLVPPVEVDSNKFALSITIEQVLYDRKVSSYDKQIKSGDLKSSVYSDGTRTGTMLTGKFSKDAIGTAVLFKMRDRTLTVRTDGETFTKEFEKVLDTIDFNE